MRMMEKWARALGACCLALGALIPAWGQEGAPKKESTFPPTEVTAPKITPPAPLPTTLPTPLGSMPDPGTGAPAGTNDVAGSSLFAAQGFGNYSGLNPLGTGAPLSLFNNPRSIASLSPQYLQEGNFTTTADALQRLPGILVQRTNAGGGSLIIRGRNGNQNVITVDGIPINDSGWRFGNVQYLNFFDPGSIQSIDVLRGPASVLYGSGALGGVLNINTKRRTNFSSDFGLNGGLMGEYSSATESIYNRVETEGNVGCLGFFMGGSYFNSRNWHSGEGVFYPETAVGYDQMAGDVRFDYLLNENATLTFVYQHFFQNNVPRTDRFPLPQVDPTRFGNNPTSADQSRDFGYLRLNLLDDAPGLINSLQLTAFLQRRIERERDLLLANSNNMGGLTPVTRRERESIEEVNYGGFDLRAYTRLGQNHTLSYGGIFTYETVDGTRFSKTGAAAVVPATPTLPPDGAYRQFGLFLFDTWTPTQDLTVTSGVRYSDINAKGTARFLGAGVNGPVKFDKQFSDWVGEAGFNYRLTDNLAFLGSVSQGFRAPNLEDLGAAERQTGVGIDNGNVDLNSDQVINFETGFRYLGERFSGQVTFYHTNANSLIARTFTPPPGNTITRQNSEGFTDGIEFEAQYLLTDAISVFVAGSDSYAYNESRNEPARTLPAFLTLGSRYTYRAQTFSFFLEGFTDMMSAYRDLGAFDRNDIRVPIGGEAAWQTFNVRGGLDLQRGGRFTMGWYNLFDQNYRILGSGLDAPGSDLRVGYELRF